MIIRLPPARIRSRNRFTGADVETIGGSQYPGRTMQIAPEIAFHNIPKSDWAEQEIRTRIAKLEKLYDRLVTVRVRVDQRATNSHGTIPPVVHIEMGIPGRKDLVV